ncbi:hypothetical protein STEG23_016662 [Scotinomys teguina]
MPPSHLTFFADDIISYVENMKMRGYWRFRMQPPPYTNKATKYHSESHRAAQTLACDPSIEETENGKIRSFPCPPEDSLDNEALTQLSGHTATYWSYFATTET